MSPSDHSREFKKVSQEVNRIHRASLGLTRAGGSRRPKKKHDVRYKINNKLKGSYGETDLNTRTITVNKRLHKRDKEPLIDTMVHERMHLDHPKMREKTVRKLTPKKVKRMTRKSKARLYAKFN